MSAVTSPVVHIRGLGNGVTSTDLVKCAEPFGPVQYVMMLPNRGQALVEVRTVLKGPHNLRSCGGIDC